MSAFIFVLIPNKQAEVDMQQWKEGREEKGKEAYKVLLNLFPSGPGKGIARSLGFRCLSKLKHSDKLYIYSHASVHRGVVGADRDDGTRKEYSSSELADLLEKEGLPKNFRDLRLYGCNTGLGSDREDLDPIAWTLKQDLVARGYHNIVITGYRGKVMPEHIRRQDRVGNWTEGKHKGIEGDAHFYMRSSALRRQF